MNDRYQDGRRAAVPDAIALLQLGFSFRAPAQRVWYAQQGDRDVDSRVRGSAQFGALAALSAGGRAIAAGVLLNPRFLPMGIAVAPSLRHAAGGRAPGG